MAQPSSHKWSIEAWAPRNRSCLVFSGEDKSGPASTPLWRGNPGPATLSCHPVAPWLWPGLLCVLSSGRPRPTLLAAGPSLPELRGHLLQEGSGPCSPTQAPSPDLPHGSLDVWPRITAASPLRTPRAPREPAVYGTEEALPLRSLIHSPGQCAPLHLLWSRRQNTEQQPALTQAPQDFPDLRGPRSQSRCSALQQWLCLRLHIGHPGACMRADAHLQPPKRLI